MARVILLGAIAVLAATCAATADGTAVTQGQPAASPFDAAALAAPEAMARVAALQPTVAVKYNGRPAKTAVNAAQSPAADVARGALVGLVRCDEALKLFVTADLLGSIERTESFISLTFQNALILKSVSGASMSVRSVVVPLTGRWSQKGQTFFYEDAERNDWFALRWNAPDSSMWQALLASVARMTQ